MRGNTWIGGTAMDTAEILRERIVATLQMQGFDTSGKMLSHPAITAGDKDALRRMQSKAVQDFIDDAQPSLHYRQHEILSHFASGGEVVPERIVPRLLYAKHGSLDYDIVRYVRLSSSVPNARPWTREHAFVVRDDTNGKVMGVLALGCPVRELPARDSWIGWTSKEQRLRRLNDIAEAATLVSIPPYSQLLGGKLIALAAVSNEVRSLWCSRWNAELAAVTTMSAFGKSSVYNRLKYRDERTFIPVGYTKGAGTFHLDHGDLIARMRDFINHNRKEPIKNRLQIVSATLSKIRLPRNWIYHGCKRQIYFIPMVSDAAGYLRGDFDAPLDYIHRPFHSIAAWWRDRWMLKRASWDLRYQDCQPDDLRLWPDYTGMQATQLGIDFG